MGEGAGDGEVSGSGIWSAKSDCQHMTGRHDVDRDCCCLRHVGRMTSSCDVMVRRQEAGRDLLSALALICCTAPSAQPVVMGCCRCCCTVYPPIFPAVWGPMVAASAAPIARAKARAAAEDGLSCIHMPPGELHPLTAQTPTLLSCHTPSCAGGSPLRMLAATASKLQHMPLTISGKTLPLLSVFSIASCTSSKGVQERPHPGSGQHHALKLPYVHTEQAQAMFQLVP